MGDAAEKRSEDVNLAQALRELAEAIRKPEAPAPAATADDEWMTPEAAAEWLNIHVQTLRATINDEAPIWAKKFGQATRISRSLLLSSQQQPTKKKARR